MSAFRWNSIDPIGRFFDALYALIGAIYESDVLNEVGPTCFIQLEIGRSHGPSRIDENLTSNQ